MASKQYVFKGKAMWARVFEENRDMFEWDDSTGAFDKPSTCDGTYSISLVVDDDTYKDIKRSGSMAAKFAKLDDDGNDVVRFKRMHTKRGKGGKVLEFSSGAPSVVDGSGNKWTMEDNGEIGNGSDVEVTVTVYDTSYSPGTTLEEIKVVNHVEVKAKETEATEGEMAW